MTAHDDARRRSPEDARWAWRRRRCSRNGSRRRRDGARAATGHRPAHPPPVLQRHRRPARQRADHGEPAASLRRPHVQQRPDDPRRQRPAAAEAGRRSSPAATSRARITCRWPTTCCCSPTAPTSSRCSPTTTCAATSRTRWPTASPTGRSSAPGLSIHDISRAAGDAGDRVPRDAGAGHQPPVVAGRALRLRVGALRRLHRSHPVRRRSADDHQAGDRRRAGGCPA